MTNKVAMPELISQMVKERIKRIGNMRLLGWVHHVRLENLPKMPKFHGRPGRFMVQ